MHTRDDHIYNIFRTRNYTDEKAAVDSLLIQEELQKSYRTTHKKQQLQLNPIISAVDSSQIGS